MTGAAMTTTTPDYDKTRYSIDDFTSDNVISIVAKSLGYNVTTKKYSQNQDHWELIPLSSSQLCAYMPVFSGTRREICAYLLGYAARNKTAVSSEQTIERIAALANHGFKIYR